MAPRGLRAAKRAVIRRTRSPFTSDDPPLIVHCAHHKVGTVWIHQSLTNVARHHGLNYALYGPTPSIPPSVDIAVFEHTRHFNRDLVAGRTLRGSHMVRDPRDVIVSGYFYHLRTSEAWTHVPRPELDGKSYQEHLNSLDKSDGLLREIRNPGRLVLAEMSAWDYTQADFLEVRYEDLIDDEQAGFERMFAFYGFSSAAAERAAAETARDSAAARSTATSGGHIRSGRPGDWRDHLEAAHLEAIEEAAPGLIEKLGYT